MQWEIQWRQGQEFQYPQKSRMEIQCNTMLRMEMQAKLWEWKMQVLKSLLIKLDELI